MRTPPPLRGVQIPYMPAKTNSKVIPSVLCTAYFEDTRFVQGAIHTPGRGGGGGSDREWEAAFLFPKCLPLFTVFYLSLKTLQVHRHFLKKCF